MSDTWYYADQGQRLGPVSSQDLKTALARMPNAREVLVWRDGFADWKRAGDVPELWSQAASPPLPPGGTFAAPPARTDTPAGLVDQFRELFFNFKGRLNRAKFWLVVLINVVAVLVSVLGIMFAFISSILSAVFGLLSFAVSIVCLIGALASSIRRLHDRNKSGHWLWLFPGLLVLLAIVSFAVGPDSLLGVVIGLANFAFMVWMIVELGILRGTVGPNQYGADPLEGRS